VRPVICTLCVLAVACAQGGKAGEHPDGSIAGDGHGGDGSGGVTTHVLSVTITNNSGSGSVASAPAGISCGSDCSESFIEGANVTLTATPAVHSDFTGWSGGGCGATNPCVVHLTTDTQVMASFTSRCDAFDGADGTTIAGWTEQIGDWVRVGGSIEQAATGGVYTHHITKDNSMQTDGCANLVANLGPGPANIQAVGVVLRWTSSTSYVVALIQNNSGTLFNQTYIYQYPGEIQLAAGTVMNYGLSSGVEACITGTTVTLKIDTNLDGTPESTLTGTTALTGPGLAGIMTHSFGAPSLADNFCWGP
jgi:hypothetical protein